MRSPPSFQIWRTPLRPRDANPEAGFSLLEVVIALGILAASLSVLFGVISNGIARIREADATTEAVTLAQTVLARVGSEMPLREGHASGQFPHGFDWAVTIARYGDAADGTQWPLSAYTIDAEVSWADGAVRRSVSVRTLRLGPREANR
jgi:general secretion pathway protein I